MKTVAKGKKPGRGDKKNRGSMADQRETQNRHAADGKLRLPPEPIKTNAREKDRDRVGEEWCDWRRLNARDAVAQNLGEGRYGLPHIGNARRIVEPADPHTT